ncbi:uncharacterized protein LOC126572012 [Anopheles aquasalis]|uniref:uncharacterized protein LOC126572012 n=1 Tax=Anopheles aquasalis TaxID=42839 RepID=UPI00215B72F3|nr:uncharacterized protein LOC126572012 [Anopheles aquasalis]
MAWRGVAWCGVAWPPQNAQPTVLEAVVRGAATESQVSPRPVCSRFAFFFVFFSSFSFWWKQQLVVVERVGEGERVHVLGRRSTRQPSKNEPMLRQLFNLARLVLVAGRKYGKPLILLVSFAVFVWLIVDTVHRPEFVRPASSSQQQDGGERPERWSESSVQQFLVLLGLDPNAQLNADGQHLSEQCQLPVSDAQLQQQQQQQQHLLLTAFAGGSLLENLWHYFSLIALTHTLGSERRTVQPLLTVSAAEQLGELFTSIPYETIDDVDRLQCYELAAAYILDDANPVPVPPDSQRPLYILNNNAKRTVEIAGMRWREQWAYFDIGEEQRQVALGMLAELQQRAHQAGDEVEAAADLQFVGINIGADDGLPFEYYYRAISFQRKMHDGGRLAVVAICEQPDGKVCRLLDAPGEQSFVVSRSANPVTDWALMVLLNHTIVSSEQDIFPALVRDSGRTVVSGQYVGDVAIVLSNLKEQWYALF